MMDVVKSLKNLIKLREVRIDNSVFRLHCKATVLMLAAFTILLTSKQFFGEPIHCISDNKKTDQTTLNTYCWIHGTFTLRETLNQTNGLQGLGTRTANSVVLEHQYYQWVCLVFFLQAVFFYLPRYMWKTWEGGRLHSLVSDLRHPLVSSTWTRELKTKIVEYVLCGKYVHGLYAFRYTVCEILNFVNVIFQVFMLDLFLNHKFLTYGSSYLKWLHSDREENIINPMSEIFPINTKCTYNQFGHSGSSQDLDHLCVLTLNILNEKLFLILWFWYIFLTVVSLFALVYRFFTFFSRLSRVYILRSLVRDLDKFQAVTVVNELSYGDFFVLYLLGKNINPIIFQELINAIYSRLRDNRKNAKSYKYFTDLTSASSI